MLYPYTLLTPRSDPDRSRSNIITHVFLSRKYSRFLALALTTLVIFLFFIPHNDAPQSPTDPPYPPYPIPYDIPPTNNTKPPLYKRYTAYEKALPQHNESLPFPEGSHTKFIFFANHAWGGGWGNVMQEMIMSAHLAYSSGRAFVFDNYMLNRDGPEYSELGGQLVPSRIPLSAFAAGPLAGGPYSNSDSATAPSHPRFVSRHYYKRVCPHPYTLHSRVFKEAVSPDASGLEMLYAWAEILQSIEDRCVEVQKDTYQLFDIWFIGTSRIHDILPLLVTSPVVKEFSWSPLIHYAFQQNQHHFIPPHDSAAQPSPVFSSFSSYFLKPTLDNTTTIHGHPYIPTPPTTKTTSLPILALHVRRGDFVDHCQNLYQWGAKYNGINTYPSLPDRFFTENETLLHELSEDEIRARYFDQCFVSVDKVRERAVRAVKEWRAERIETERRYRRTWWGWFNSFWDKEEVEEKVRKMLRKVYVMSNGDREWLDELKDALHKDAQHSNDSDRYSTHQGNSDRAGKYDYDFVWSWDEISTSLDVELGWEAKYVAQAMDMYVGQRAELFIGNGFSSLTANVVLLRIAAGVDVWRTRFW